MGACNFIVGAMIFGIIPVAGISYHPQKKLRDTLGAQKFTEWRLMQLLEAGTELA